MLVKKNVAEPMLIHKTAAPREMENRVLEVLSRVGLGKTHMMHPRCAHASEICKREVPALEAAEGDHVVACHRWRDISE